MNSKTMLPGEYIKPYDAIFEEENSYFKIIFI